MYKRTENKIQKMYNLVPVDSGVVFYFTPPQLTLSRNTQKELDLFNH